MSVGPRISDSPPERIDVGGHALGVRLLGEGERTFVCLHGLVDTMDVWSRLAPHLATRGRVVLLDQRGHGVSDAPEGPYRREDLAVDVVAVLQRLGMDQAILVGHSMGGIVAMTAALAWPERISGLLLLGTASQCHAKVARFYERVAVAAETEGKAGLVRTIFGAEDRRSVTGNPRGIAHVTRALKSLHDDPLTPKLVRVRCPVLVMVGEKDPMSPKASQILHKAISGATLEILPQRGHWLHLEAPEEVVAATDRWLSGLQAPADPAQKHHPASGLPD